jgi:pimeloyl-ACP methyl ester carboxylesterase
MRFLYIHGFASSPQSRKAGQFRAALASRGIRSEIPAMDGGNFEHLTISGQLNVVEKIIDGEPVCLIGSSMGGFLAALYASTHPEVSRLALLAPAFGFAGRWDKKIRQEKLDEPAPADFEVFHYGDNCLRRVHYGLIEDALRFPAAPDFAQPALIFHGLQDDVVPIEYSRGFARTHPNVRLVELDSDHELLNVLDQIIGEAIPFLLD